MDHDSERQSVEDQIRAEDARTVAERAARLLNMPKLHIIPMGPFAAPSAECTKLFRDGYFFGCIMLAQAVTDAIVRHIDWTEFPDAKQGPFVRLPKRLEKLHKHKLVSDDTKADIEKLWAFRNDFHHLDPRTQIGYQQLENTAKETLVLLSKIETYLFGYTIHEGAIYPNKPQYWNIKDGKALAFIRRQ